MEGAEKPYSTTNYRWHRQRKGNEDKDNQINNWSEPQGEGIFEQEDERILQITVG